MKKEAVYEIPSSEVMMLNRRASIMNDKRRKVFTDALRHRDRLIVKFFYTKEEENDNLFKRINELYTTASKISVKDWKEWEKRYMMV